MFKWVCSCSRVLGACRPTVTLTSILCCDSLNDRICYMTRDSGHPCIKIFLLTGGLRSGTLTSALLIHAFYKNTKCKNESFIIPQYHLQRSARTEIRMCLMRNDWLVMLIMYRSRTKTTNLTNPPTRYLLTYNSNQTLPWTYRTASEWSVNMLLSLFDCQLQHKRCHSLQNN